MTSEAIGQRSPDYREITPDWFFGGTKTELIEVTFLTAKPNAFEQFINKKEVMDHTEEVTLKLTPQTSKSLAIWIIQNVKAYENQHGKIKNVELENDDPQRQQIAILVEELLAKV